MDGEIKSVLNSCMDGEILKSVLNSCVDCVNKLRSVLNSCVDWVYTC